MKALADENFPLADVEELRVLGWDILTAREWRPATDDEDVAAKARTEGRILLTFDKDFGELCWGGPPVASHAIILFRVATLPAEVRSHPPVIHRPASTPPLPPAKLPPWNHP